MKKILSILFIINYIFSFAQTRQATGLNFNDNTYKTTRGLSPAMKFSGGDIPYYSLKKYCPTPGNQGNIGSCVGWATGYAALTIADAISNNITNTAVINQRVRSSMFLYLQIVESCPQGSYISDALELAKTEGDILHKDLGAVSCGTSISSALKSLAKDFKIKDYYTLFNLDATSQQKIIATRNSLNSNKPVVIGMNVTASFNTVGSTGYYNPLPGEENLGGHALCVIGYDDQAKRFEIINSWGTGWGNNGFFTISYDDYARLCKYGYQFTLANSSPSKLVELEGDFKFKKLLDGAFNEIPVTLNGNTYTINDVRVNDFFRIAASHMLKDKFVYIFSIKPDNSAEVLFPTSKMIDAVTIKDIPVVPSKDVILEIPVNERKGLTTDMPGEDMLCILYSTEELNDLDDIVRKVKNSTGDYPSRVQLALGNRMIPFSNIKYKPNEMGLTAKSTSGVVAPLILKVQVNK